MMPEHRQRSKLNHHLYMRHGVWWTRIVRNGSDERESTGCPKSEVVAARLIRDRRLGEAAERRAGLERPGRPLTLGELIAAYLADESGHYDREKGGEQPGTKRSWEADRTAVKQILRHVSPNISTATVDREFLLDLARKREKETPTPAPGTRRKTFAFLRRAFSWATERPKRTGVVRSPFAELTRSDRARLFPKAEKRAYLYSPDELRAIYERLPSYEAPFVRFAVHTGMRLREITTLTWGNVSLERRTAHVEARFAKNGRARDVVLGEIATSILFGLRRANPAVTDHVFLGRRGVPLRDVRGGFDQAVLAVWKPSRPGERKPRFHDLRKTGATRVEAVSSHAVAKAFLGHADENVTDTYIVPSLQAVHDAINRAARSIDGQTPAGAIPFPSNMARQMAQQPEDPAASAR
jgi:integrase